MIGDCVISVWSFIHSFIHSAYFYSASSSPLLLRGDPDTARILRRSFTPKRHRQLRVKDLSHVTKWRLERDSNPRPFRPKASNLPMSHHVSHVVIQGSSKVASAASPVVKATSLSAFPRFHVSC